LIAGVRLWDLPPQIAMPPLFQSLAQESGQAQKPRVVRAQPRDPFVIVASPAIDPKMVVRAPESIDPKMVFRGKARIRETQVSPLPEGQLAPDQNTPERRAPAPAPRGSAPRDWGPPGPPRR
jgi:hypothetical protein